MGIVAIFLFAVIAGAPVSAAQSVAPQQPMPGPIPPLNKESLELMLKALIAQQQLESGSLGSGGWQMLGATAGSVPAVWLLNSSTGELSFCTAPPNAGASIICYTKK